MSQNDIESWIPTIRTVMKPPEGEINSKTPPFYQLGEELGHGGMGAVFLARLQPLGVLRALKVLCVLQQASTEQVQHAEERFLREARIMGNLRHPAVVKALDYQVLYMTPSGQELNHPFLIYAMEPCLVEEGELPRICAAFQMPCTTELKKERDKRHGSVSLQTFLTAGCVFPEQTVARFARELIAVLRSAHEQEFKIGDEHVKGIVHRDVKPSNILVGADGRLRLTDFGISKPSYSLTDAGNGLLTPGSVLVTSPGGTRGYAAPEQTESDDEKTVEVKKEADYYSLGVVLYQLLTRTLPDPKQPWKNPSSLATGISSHWDILLRGMLRHYPTSRLANPDLLDYEFAEIEAGRG
jgi:serine/threonine protein kinase